MAKIADPHDALPSFENALKHGYISPKRCALHPELAVLIDDANGDMRITYALIVGGKVKATVAYLRAEPLLGEHCFQVGYAVAKPYRGEGIASDILIKSINEMRHVGSLNDMRMVLCSLLLLTVMLHRQTNALSELVLIN